MAYITIANASSIIFKSDLKQVDLKKQLYKIPIYFFNTYEKNALLAFQELLLDPEKYFTEIYKPYRAIDTYTPVFEGRLPAYHNESSCSRLNADFENYEINNLNFKLTDGDMYEVTFDVKVTTSYDNWKNADENFKKNAIEGRLEVEFSLEDEDKLFFNGEDFQKEYDGLTKLILN